MKPFRISISNHTVRRARVAFQNWRARRVENKLRNKSFTDKRYWRATSKGGTVDLGHLKERQAIKAAAKFGPIVYNDWINAIIVYDDGSLKGGD